MRAKIILKAALKKLVLFANENEFDNYLRHLRDRRRQYKVLEKRVNDDDSVTAVISEQYNDVQLME